MAGVRAAAAPGGEELYAGHSLRVSGVDVPVYACRVSAVPFNQFWPGYQRPLDQTELAGLAYWDMAGPVRVEIDCPAPPKSVAVRPSIMGIAPEVSGTRIAFDLPAPRPLVVEIDGPHQVLHLLPSPPERDAPSPSAPNVRYFGPGVHHPGRMHLASGETVHIAAGAVVYGAICAEGAEGIRIAGRGILDQSRIERSLEGGALRFTDCSDVTIEGIVVRDTAVWCCSLFGCRDAVIRDLKLVGHWRYNADGIDICNSENVVVEDCFVRAYDDALVVKGLIMRGDLPVRNVVFRRCVVWCDWGRAMEIGAETYAPEISHVVFEDSDIVRATHVALDIQHCDHAAVTDIRFESIRIEMPEPNPCPAMQEYRGECYQPTRFDYLPHLATVDICFTRHSKDTRRGTARDVVFRNIDVQAPRMPWSVLRGYAEDADVAGVVLGGWRLNGVPLGDLAAMNLDVGAHVSGIRTD